jgi:transcriptional regulator with XRE-family HTH domain
VSSTLESLARSLRARRALPTPEVCKSIRIDAGATQQEVAYHVGVTVAAISGYESGLYRPRAEHLTRYLEVLSMLRDAP